MVYLVHVDEDGDTQVCMASEEPAYCTDVVLHSVEDLARELKSYGHDEDAITEVLNHISSGHWIDV